MPRSPSLELTVGSLAPGGDGVAHVELDGERRAVFLPHTAPGDVVRAEVDASRRPARGRVLDVLVAGPGRVKVPCPWFSRCGGCDWMHLSLEAQGRAHVEHVTAALPAPWRELPVQHRATTDGLAYRTRTRLHVRCERGRVEIGMHESGTHDPVVVDRCAVLRPGLETARQGLAALFEGSRGRGDVQLALGMKGLPVLEVRWTGDVAPACFAGLERAVVAGELAGARVLVEGSSRPATVGDPTPWIRGADDLPLRLAPGGFGQASEGMNVTLALHVAALAHPLALDRAVELYAGSGNL
ncbi:MAG TPA: TRAM domain-containing protein, partial [Polyangiaceae bacterium]